jgi:hypothetical protein
MVYLGSHKDVNLFYYSEIDKFILCFASNSTTYEIHSDGGLKYFHDKESHFFVKTFKADNYIQVECGYGESYYRLANRLYMARILESIF